MTNDQTNKAKSLRSLLLASFAIGLINNTIHIFSFYKYYSILLEERS